MSTDKVRVAIRVRPFSRREIDLNTQCVLSVQGQQIIIQPPAGSNTSSVTGKERQSKTSKNFAFDACFWSFDEDDAHFASQEKVYHELGLPLLASSFAGYNGCIFAYGQTGSGKSYSMMGTSNNKGLIPRLCDGLFDQIAQISDADENTSFKVEVSYMEIYNEKVHDLLAPRSNKANLRVREHAILGPYVDGLSTLAVSSFDEIDVLMAEGNKCRTVAATNMNSESSRSHAVFTLTLTCVQLDLDSGISGEKVSKVSLVDLAGSERAVKTGAVGDRLKEGSNINKSLTTLGLVISKLAEGSGGKGDNFVPYRDSVLTWLLKDNLGGNSKTVMVATVSPAGDNFEETLSTLRYADRAKRIVNHAVVNEDPNARMIRELKTEVEQLREQLKMSAEQSDLKERLNESEKIIKEMSRTWEEKLKETEKAHTERQHALEKLGISVQSSGIRVEANRHFLVNLNADPSLNELLVYYLKDSVTRVGSASDQDIQLSGVGIQKEHCCLEVVDSGERLILDPREGARSCVNGLQVSTPTQLRHGDRLVWGNNHFFKVSCPRSTRSTNDHIPQLEPQTSISDFDMARQEMVENVVDALDPVNGAVRALEEQHEQDKQRALDQQRLMYERQLQRLKAQMSPSTPYAPYGFDTLGGRQTPSAIAVHKDDQERDELFRKSLAQLKEAIVRANALVLEANALSQELKKATEFKVTLQVPAERLSPNSRQKHFLSEPAVLVTRKGRPSQIWSCDKLDNKLVEMRELYSERGDSDTGEVATIKPVHIDDPFFETQENHHLIGVANVFLLCLFHDITLDYQVPIISQQGKLTVNIQRKDSH